MSLRTDERSWLIYDEESIGAVARGLEAYALSVTGQKLRRHPDQKIRGIGNLMMRLGEQRGAEMLQNDGAQAVAMEWFLLLGAHLAGMPHDELKCAQALDELHSAAVRIDSRLQTAGSVGGGVHRIIGRGD